MYYNDGPSVDEKGRIKECPLCNNEEFSANAYHCRICGLHLVNQCGGCEDYDNRGNHNGTDYHNNPVNARYCEICGTETQFFSKGILKKWEEVKELYLQESERFPQTPTPGPPAPKPEPNSFVALTNNIDDDDDLPF